MGHELDRIFERIREQHAALRNACDRESIEAHLRSLAGESDPPIAEPTAPNFPKTIHVAFATCACGVREFIVDGSTQECQFCGGLMFRQESAEYELILESGA
jgi:hypothetical protein